MIDQCKVLDVFVHWKETGSGMVDVGAVVVHSVELVLECFFLPKAPR